MRFAIKTRPEHTPWARILDLWQAADEISLFESAWNWDHFYPLTGDLAGPNLEGWTMLAALAQATSCRRCANASTASTRAWRRSSPCSASRRPR